MAESLRERKKARTRAELIRVSQRLFHERGFAGTTLDQICDEVQVVPQTLLRYFDSKHKLALAPHYDALHEFEVELARPDRRTGVLETWAAFALRRAADAQADPRPFQLSHSTTELRNAQFDLLVAYEELLREWLQRESAGGIGRDDLDVRLLSCLLVSGEHAIYRGWLEGDTNGDLARDLQTMIERAQVAFPLGTVFAADGQSRD